MKRYNVSQAKEVPGRDKPVWLRHGIAFQKDGKAVRIKLESLPLPNKDGEIWLTLFEDDGERSKGATDGFTPTGYDNASGGASGSPGSSDGLDDEIPW
jgi:hypothetical protein